MAKSKKAAVKRAQDASESFKWGNTMPCVATYKILEGDKFMDEFEDASVAFEDAGTLAIGSLRFFPHVTDDSETIRLLAMQISRRFLTLIQKTFTIEIPDTGDSAFEIIVKIAGIFGDPQKTLTDLAELVSAQIVFPAQGNST